MQSSEKSAEVTRDVLAGEEAAGLRKHLRYFEGMGRAAAREKAKVDDINAKWYLIGQIVAFEKAAEKMRKSIQRLESVVPHE